MRRENDSRIVRALRTPLYPLKYLSSHPHRADSSVAAICRENSTRPSTRVATASSFSFPLESNVSRLSPCSSSCCPSSTIGLCCSVLIVRHVYAASDPIVRPDDSSSSLSRLYNGSSILKIEPRPTSLDTRMLPPIRSSSSLEIARPSPVPRCAES